MPTTAQLPAPSAKGLGKFIPSEYFCKLSNYVTSSKRVGPADSWGAKSILHLSFWLTLLGRHVVA